MLLRLRKSLVPVFSLLLALPLGACLQDESSDGSPNGEAGKGAVAPQGGGAAEDKEGADDAKDGDFDEEAEGGSHFPGSEGKPGPSTGSGGDSGANSDGDTQSPDGNSTDGTDTGTDPAPECNEVDPVTLYLSPDDSNSLSSPAQLKQRLLGEHSGPELYGVPLRGWEFFNYYSFPYPEPAGTLGTTLELRAVGDAPGHYRLQIGVRSKSWTYQQRPAMNLTFVLDTSGSMAGPAMSMLKASVRTIASGLRAGDRVSMVTWSSTQQVLLDSHTVTAAGDPRVLNISNALEPGGGTDLHGGLSKGYELAQKNYLADAINRIILVSDGGANLGITSKELIGQHAKDSGKDGIYLAGVGVGTESTYNDQLMDAVTDAGKGASVFIPSDAEAARIFGDQFLSTFGIAAKNVQVQLDLPPGFELVNFSGEEASTDPSKVEPQHLGPNDSMVFYQEIKNCAPQKLDPNGVVKVTVRYQDARTHQPGQLVTESTIAQLMGAPALALEKGTALTAFLNSAKAQQRRDPNAPALRATAQQALDQAIAAAPGDTELKELLTMLNRMK